MPRELHGIQVLYHDRKSQFGMFVLSGNIVEALNNAAALHSQTDGPLNKSYDGYWIHDINAMQVIEGISGGRELNPIAKTSCHGGRT